jgi:hypothetical protein
MIYLKSIGAGAVAAVAALVVFAKIISAKYRGQGIVAINILAPFTLSIILVAFVIGFYLAFKFQK